MRGRDGLAAATFYLVAFAALTWPAMTHFTTHWFTDAGDGLQNVWNLWWVRYAVTVLHQNPWTTSYLHYPYGTSLLGHTLNPFNGFVGIGLAAFLSPLVVHNTIVLLGFVGGGVTAFLLAHDLTRSVPASLLGGFVFTFSSFHFAHAEGHLQLVSLEWMPLFVLMWLRLLARPSIALGVATALVLFLVILCDYYYFLYCVMMALAAAMWWAWRNGGLFSLFEARRRAALGVFAVAALATSGTLAIALVWASIRDPFTGVHPASEYSLDLLSPLIYGGHWRFGQLTRPFWSRLPANIHESSVHLGFAVIALSMYAWHERRALRIPEIGFFAALLGVFFVLALGPTPQIAGKAVLAGLPILPYAWLEALFPPLALSGVPIRMMVVVTLSAAMLGACGLTALLRGSRRDHIAAAVLIAVLVAEYLPAPIPTLSITPPGYVAAVRDLPGKDGVLDTVSTPSLALFYQTLHEKPIAFGYLAREPETVWNRDDVLQTVESDGRLDRLWPEFKLRYVIANEVADSLRTWGGARTIWDDGATGVFDVSGLTADGSEIAAPR